MTGSCPREGILAADRVLIYPHGLAKKWLATADISHVDKSLPKMYVGVTRARYSLAFVYDAPAAIAKAKAFVV